MGKTFNSLSYLSISKIQFVNIFINFHPVDLHTYMGKTAVHPEDVDICM